MIGAFESSGFQLSFGHVSLTCRGTNIKGLLLAGGLEQTGGCSMPKIMVDHVTNPGNYEHRVDVILMLRGLGFDATVFTYDFARETSC